MAELKPTVMALQCPVCEHKWPVTIELPMVVDAFVMHLRGACICPQCGNASRSYSKSIKLLTGKLFHQALVEFRAAGRVPQDANGGGMSEGEDTC